MYAALIQETIPTLFSFNPTLLCLGPPLTYPSESEPPLCRGWGKMPKGDIAEFVHFAHREMGGRVTWLAYV